MKLTTAAALVFFSCLAGCSLESSDEVVVYSALDREYSEPILERFTRETGIRTLPKYDLESAKTVGLTSAIIAEARRPRCDIFWNNEILNTLRLKEQGLLEVYQSPQAKSYPEAFRDADGQWHGFAARARILIVNRDVVRESERPTSILDLLDPKWKGRIAFTDPANSGSAYATVTMLVDLWGGGDAGWKKVGELFRNMKVLNRSSLVFQGVGNGEYPLGISLEYAGPLWAHGGAPVKVVYPSDGTTASMGGVAVIKGGPNTENARIFVDYINRRTVREMILKATFRRPTRNDLDLSSLPGGLPPLSQVKLVNYDEEGWTEKRAKTLEKIKDVLQDSR
jgi:iron(III) transport system substrate-binding protein